MRSSRIPAATELAMLRANGALTFLHERGSIVAIYDEEFVLTGADAQIEGSAPALTCRTDDVERLKIIKGDVIRADGFEKKVARIAPDGTGQTILVLQR
jgi:hypothetical protein